MPKPALKEKSASGLSLDEYIGRQAAAKAAVGSKEDVQIKVKVRPPPAAVRSVRELIFWEYAKLIGRSAGFDGNYGFIMSRYKKLKDGQIKMSGLNKDEEESMKIERECVYCGSKENLSVDHIIPLRKGGPDSTSNKVLCCKKCNSSKQDKDIFEWYYIVKKENEIPKHVWSKYLKLVWHFHVAHDTIDRVDINLDGKLDVLDLGAIFKTYEEKR
jgi:5-methylcytosine-specific restriction endonuclease McrA